MAQPIDTDKWVWGGLGKFHIATIEQLDELPSSIHVRLARLAKVLHFPECGAAQNGVVSTKMFGETITMTPEVRNHLLVIYALEK